MTTAVAEHRPATKQRKYRHDELTALDLFSGFGGLTQGIKRAGFEVIMAANHNRYKVQVHERNHPEAEHWVADLVDDESADYHDVRDLPRADLLVAGVSCVNHSQANTKKAYATGASLFDMDDPDYEERVTKSEKDRATANCVLHYAERHRPLMILVECTTELVSWGPAVPGKKKVGDGTTYRWWLKQFENRGYRYKVLRLNSMFFKVPQSRDRLYIVFWLVEVPAPDLDHCPLSWCHACDDAVEAVWSWKTGVPPTGSVRYGKQYEYRCPRCRRAVLPPATPSLTAIDFTNLGTRIRDREAAGLRKLKDTTYARAGRCHSRFGDFPAVLMPAKAIRGAEKHPWEPMATQTSQQETAILSTGAIMVAAGNTYERPGSECRSRDLTEPLWAQTATNAVGLVTPPVAMAITNYQGAPRGVDEPLPTQGGSETMALLSSGIIPFRRNTIPTVHAEAMPTVTSEQIPGLLTAAGWFKQNGSGADATAPHPVTDPFGTLTSRDTTGMLLAQYRQSLAEVELDDCYFRMLGPHEVGRGCGFDPDFGDHKGTFEVWGSDRDQVDGYGNAVSPPVGEWIGGRLYAALHGRDLVGAA
ncbi:DNA cytosine methyltransferase [Tsukamurella hominis]|uniref:DNA cytosine methyltransferase n=1 Tax=Tsukamurella hominis TaxID=1970232 RepID=UPI0039EB7871